MGRNMIYVLTLLGFFFGWFSYAALYDSAAETAQRLVLSISCRILSSSCLSTWTSEKIAILYSLCRLLSRRPSGARRPEGNPPEYGAIYLCRGEAPVLFLHTPDPLPSKDG